MTQLIGDQASSLVRERDRRRIRAMAGVLGLSSVLVGGGLGYVWLHVQRVRVSYEVEDLRRLRAEVEEQNKKLHLELASLRSFARVDSMARRLGFTQPGRDQVRLAREFVGPEHADRETASLRTAARDDAMILGRSRP